jgi:hypothetical protein
MITIAIFAEEPAMTGINNCSSPGNGAQIELAQSEHGVHPMTCPEFEKMSRDVEYYRSQLQYFLFHRGADRLPDEKARRSANEAAAALARASNLLYRHENYCSICKRISKYCRAQEQVS